jgi:hypothetical protein
VVADVAVVNQMVALEVLAGVPVVFVDVVVVVVVVDAIATDMED